LKDNKIIEKSRIAQPTPTEWALTEEQKITYQSLFILYLMVKNNKKLIDHTPVEVKIKKILGIKVSQEDPDWIYSPTPAATDVINQYEQRYIEFLRFYDVFAHVDPQEGTFAMSNMGKLLVEEGKEEWAIDL